VAWESRIVGHDEGFETGDYRGEDWVADLELGARNGGWNVEDGVEWV